MDLYKVHISLLLLFLGLYCPSTISICEIRHEIKVLHPGIDLHKPVQKTLVQSKCGEAAVMEYYMDVESVVCGDSQCRIDVIRIYWDELGFFKKLELPQGVELEKAEGAVFTPEDYLKLNAILSDKNSELKDVNKYEVTGSGTGEGIDAFSGATIALGANSYVKGAVWTCYTLWHWVNANTYGIIRNITGDTKRNDELLGWLNSQTKSKKIFALEQLIRRKNYDSHTITSVIEQAPQSDYAIKKLIISYAEKGPENSYFDLIDKLLKVENEELRLFLLQSLNRTDKNPNTSFYESLGENLAQWNNSYQSINSFLKLIQKKGASTPALVSQIFSLLDNEDFIIARRAYWFLKNQKVSQSEETRLKEFAKKFEDRL